MTSAAMDAMNAVMANPFGDTEPPDHAAPIDDIAQAKQQTAEEKRAIRIAQVHIIAGLVPKIRPMVGSMPKTTINKIASVIEAQ
ncbi:MAG: hypothetical protein AAGD22_07820 [Verrucomicrobiota bacterium]